MIKGIQVGNSVVPKALYEANLTATLVTINNLQLPNILTGSYDLIISGDGFRDTVGEVSVKVLSVEINIPDDLNTVCEGTTVNLVSSVDQVAYEWSTGAFTKSIEAIVTEEETFSLTITDNDGCQATAEKKVFTLPNPTASISVSPSTEVCAGQEVTLTSSPAERYFWSTGDETRTIKQRPTETTTYELTVEAVNGCRTTTEVDVKTTPGIDIQISGPREVCAGEPFTLTASGGSSYEWHDGEKTPSINLVLDQDQTYSVKAKNNEGCEAEASIDISVKSGPGQVAIEGPTEICAGQVVQLKVPTNRNWTYKWSQNAMGSILSAVNVSPQQNTTYRVTVTDKNTGCSSEASQEIKINNNLAFTIEGPDSVCRGEAAMLSIIQNDDYEYQWSTGGKEYQETVTPTGNTLYSATVTDASRGCTGIASKLVRTKVVRPKIHGPSGVCEGETVELRAEGGVQYLWGDGRTDDTIRVRLMETTDFTLTVTDGINCQADVRKRIEVYPSPKLEVEGPREVCSDEMTDLFLESDVRQALITWTSDGQLGSTSGSGPSGSMITDRLLNESSSLQTTTYTIRAESPNGCGSAEERVTIAVKPVANNSIFPFEYLSVLTGEEINIDPGVSEIEWQPVNVEGLVEGATIGSGETFQQTLSLSSSKSWGIVRYQIQTINGSAGSACSEGAQVLDIKVLPRSLVNNIFIPNLFTPNGDGVNDNWGIEYVSAINPTDYFITVFSRNGGIVLTERNIIEAALWEAEGVPAGAYIYLLKGPEMNYKGALTIQK